LSRKHPVVAITGSSGAGTSTVKHALEQIFRRETINATFVEGDSFHRYNRTQMREALREAQHRGDVLSHFGPAGNYFEKIEEAFRSYGETGKARIRRYIHDEVEAASHGQGTNAGEFTAWEEAGGGTDLLVYEGLHGGVVTDTLNVARYVDLLVGVVPIVNLEWIQKIHRDSAHRGYSQEAVVDTILRRMYDYVHYVTPQFSLSDVNFQRVPTVDTSNPFIARDVPTADESFVVIRFRDPHKFGVDFPYLLAMLHGAFMSRRNTLVVPGGRMGLAMELVLTPIMHEMVSHARQIHGKAD
jgi:phosphoribulokinase